jgi:type I restriction enzyme S subunit
MSEWKECTLRQVIQIKHGFAFSGKYFSNTGSHIVLTPGNFYEEGGFKEKGDKEKWYTGPIPVGYVLNQGDLIIAMTEQAEGLLGSSAIIPQNGLYLHNQRLGLVSILDTQKTDKKFIYYLFNIKSVRQQIRASATGVKIRHTAPSRVLDVKVKIPSLLRQRRIADTLSTYDDFIENCQRRIKILEEMARNLYREWFVRFRFPGYEKIKMVNSPLGEIPEGWEVKTLDSLVFFQKGRKSAETHDIALLDDVKLLLIDSLYGNDVKYVSPEKLILAAFQDTIMVMDGASSCNVTIGAEGAVGSTLGRFRTMQPDIFSSYALYYFLDSKAEDFKTKNIGSAIPHANKDYILRQLIAFPPQRITSQFDKIIDPIQREIRTIKIRIQILRRTRDLLLLRLMSGEIDVQ